jgi:hypothetical protein
VWQRSLSDTALAAAARQAQDTGATMRSGALVHILVAALVAVLGAGAGLGGFVRAMTGTSEHVCTCATGGTHATCPVCNPQLHDERRSTVPAFDGVPCGDRLGAVQAAVDPGVLPAPWLGPAPAVETCPVADDASAQPDTPTFAPALPPPRTATA